MGVGADKIEEGGWGGGRQEEEEEEEEEEEGRDPGSHSQVTRDGGEEKKE